MCVFWYCILCSFCKKLLVKLNVYELLYYNKVYIVNIMYWMLLKGLKKKLFIIIDCWLKLNMILERYYKKDKY